ncbi:MAG: hypothetical protein J5I98_15280, partial [Phaeodactylibacter sp.]|nr:hypothetical protein [Phaeodactylibacter sp.]
MNAISEETIALVEDFRGRFQGMGYGDGHYILACHAAFPVAFTPDMLYQIWANFKQYPAFASLPGRYRQIDPMAVSDLLLSNLCRPAALDIFEMDNEVRAYFLYKLREDRRFGQPRVLALANFLMQYWTAKTLAQYPESFKQTIYWTALATLDPDAAARKISAALLAIREEQPSEVFRMSNLLEAFSAQQPNFGNMAAYLKGMKAALLDMPQAAQEQVGRSGAFIIQEEPGPDEPVYRMPLLRQMKGKVKIKKSVPDGKDRKPAAETQYLGEVSFDQKRGWRLNRGSIHGISTHTLLEILVDENRPIFPTIEKLEGDGSILGLDAEDQLLLDEARVYLCKTAFRLNVMLRNEEAEGLEAQIEQALGSFGGLIHLTDSEREAGYLLNVRHGLLFITLPYQHDYPLARPVPLEGEESLAIEAGAQNLSRIARWEYIKAFKNKNERLSEQGHSPIRAVVHYKVGEEWLPYAYTENGAVVDYMEWVESKRTYRSYLKVELTNESDRDLYYSFFYLTINFESSGAMMDKPSERIRAGETVTIFNHKGGILPFSIEQQILDYNQPESRVWFKVIYSEQQIDTSMLKVRQLPPPEQKQFSKGRFFELDDVGLAPGKFRNWDALSITLTFKNPQYNRVSKEHFLNLMWQPSDEGLLESTGSLEAFLWQLDERLLRQLDEEPGRHRIFEMLGGNRLVPFAAAQYLAPDGLSGRLNLRTSIALIEEGVEGTMERSDAFPGNRLLKIANTYGRTVRLTDFERRVKKYPSRPLIIAEGDAWLHHPGIKDMASHLSKRYNVYSRGAAADEMRRFWVTKEYLRVIEILEEQLAPKQVAFFMLSGGGHELLVEHFREFLNAYE